MRTKAILFDFGFTLFYFDSPSVERYFECFNKGLKKAALLLKESGILPSESIYDRFIKEFHKLRGRFFKKRGSHYLV